jgi:cobalamin biosynthesis protein CobD/CbiB
MALAIQWDFLLEAWDKWLHPVFFLMALAILLVLALERHLQPHYSNQRFSQRRRQTLYSNSATHPYQLRRQD